MLVVVYQFHHRMKLQGLGETVVSVFVIDLDEFVDSSFSVVFKKCKRTPQSKKKQK